MNLFIRTAGAIFSLTVSALANGEKFNLRWHDSISIEVLGLSANPYDLKVAYSVNDNLRRLKRDASADLPSYGWYVRDVDFGRYTLETNLQVDGKAVGEIRADVINTVYHYDDGGFYDRTIEVSAMKPGLITDFDQEISKKSFTIDSLIECKRSRSDENCSFEICDETNNKFLIRARLITRSEDNRGMTLGSN